VIDPISRLNARQDLRLLMESVRRKNEGDRLAKGLVLSVPEELLGSSVPTRDDAAEVLADDRVVRRLDDGREELRVLVRGDRGRRTDQPQQRVIGRWQRRGGSLDEHSRMRRAYANERGGGRIGAKRRHRLRAEQRDWLFRE
jgi:hypothetical protein